MAEKDFYRGYEVEYTSSRDGDGFERYGAYLIIGGNRISVSWEALDYATVKRELDAFILKTYWADHTLL